MVERRGEQEQFSSDHIVECMKKGTWVSFHMIFLIFQPLRVQNLKIALILHIYTQKPFRLRGKVV